jgi:FkbM family methyltransferase
MYSQHEEQRILQDIVSDGYVVDIGAHDGKTFSNSRAFVEQGNDVLLVEANPIVYEQLKANSEAFDNATTVHAAVTDTNGSAVLHYGTDGRDGLLSTLSTDDNAWFDHARSDASVTVPATTLDDLLAEHDVPQRFGALLVDTEGMDYNVLKGHDFGTRRPEVILTESYRHDPEKHKAKHELLRAHNYIFKHQVGCNTIWKDARTTNHRSIDSDYHDIRRRLQASISKFDSVEIDPGRILEAFDSDRYDLTILKEPKWEDDAFITRIQPATELTYDWTIKVHEDKYPLASHIYDSPQRLHDLSTSRAAADVFDTLTIPARDHQFRAVMYRYMDGEPMDKVVPSATEGELASYRDALKDSVHALMDLGFNVFVRDLGDFIVEEDGDGHAVTLTDFNAIMDCGGANEYSRNNVLSIIDHVIDRLVDNAYEPFVSERPGMNDEGELDLRM